MHTLSEFLFVSEPSANALAISAILNFLKYLARLAVLRLYESAVTHEAGGRYSRDAMVPGRADEESRRPGNLERICGFVSGIDLWRRTKSGLAGGRSQGCRSGDNG